MQLPVILGNGILLNVWQHNCIPRSCDYSINVRHVQPPLYKHNSQTSITSYRLNAVQVYIVYASGATSMLIAPVYRYNTSRSTVWITTQAKPQNDASLQVAVCAIQGSHSHHHLDCYCWCHIQYSLSHCCGNDLCQYTVRSQHINFWFNDICHTGYHHDVLSFKWIHCRCLLWTTEDSRC